MPPSCTGFLLYGLQGLPSNGLFDSFVRTSNGAKLRRHISLMIMQYPIRIEVAAGDVHYGIIKGERFPRGFDDLSGAALEQQPRRLRGFVADELEVRLLEAMG
uniref:Uncharacterized protein n=1 Tax=Oryza punctata TaxID=4537 RepID=A0A0E0KNW5_ORYPU